MSKCIGKCTHVNNFYPLEVVGRGSEPQLQVCENLNLVHEGLHRRFQPS